MPPNQYASIADLEGLGIAGDALAEIGVDVKNKVLLAVSRMMDGFFAAQFTLPIKTWGLDVTMVCAEIAACKLLRGRGFNPEGIDVNIVQAHDDAMALLKIWARDDGAVPDVTDSSPNAKEQTPTARPSVTSAPSRGWSGTGLGGGRSGTGVPFTGSR
jgi:phage gp36-like protein